MARKIAAPKTAKPIGASPRNGGHDWRNAGAGGRDGGSRRKALAALKCASFVDEIARFGAMPPFALRRQGGLTRRRAGWRAHPRPRWLYKINPDIGVRR
jgi:hypothetical protein